MSHAAVFVVIHGVVLPARHHRILTYLHKMVMIGKKGLGIRG